MALTACASVNKRFSDGIVRFSKVNFQVGINNIDTFKSSGKFVCEIPGLYYISAYMYTHEQAKDFFIKKNGINVARSASDQGDTYSTIPISTVVELQIKNTLYVYTLYYIHSAYSCLSIMKLSV